jgi:poly(3-hydroxybutyrate) depolymerase
MRAANQSKPEELAGSKTSGRNPACWPFDIESVEIGKKTVRVSNADIWTAPFCALREFSRANSAPHRVLVIAPLAGAFAVLLRDVLVGLLRYRDVAITDWLDARHVPVGEGRFGVEENIEYVISAIRKLGPDLHVIAVCQGVVPALIGTAILSEYDPQGAPRSLVLIAGPVDPLANPTRVVKSLRAQPLGWFKRNVIEKVPTGYRGEGRLVYPASHQLVTFLGYWGRHLAGGGELFRKTIHDDGEDPIRFPFLSLCLSLMDLPAEFFLENVRYVFHGDGLRNPELRFLNCKVDFRKIRGTALMTVEGDRDDIAAPGQTEAAHGLCASIQPEMRSRLLIRGSGHFSLFHGDVLRHQVLPAVLDFMDAAEVVEERQTF